MLYYTFSDCSAKNYDESCSVIKKCVQKRTIAAITNERGSKEALCNQCDLFAGYVLGSRLLVDGNCDSAKSQSEHPETSPQS